MARVFIVEDNEDIRQIVVYALGSAGFEARGFVSGTDFFEEMDTSVPDLVLLDIMLPDEDGLEILTRIRNSAKTKTLPVMMLTAKGSEFDKVRGLDLGADDYVSKPFGIMELIARINAVLRRSESLAGRTERVEYGSIILDNARRAVSAGGESVTLTYKEYELLYFMMINAGLVLARDRIMEAVWGFDFEGESRTLDMHIRTLRQKLGAYGSVIKTVRNVGYYCG